MIVYATHILRTARIEKNEVRESKDEDGEFLLNIYIWLALTMVNSNSEWRLKKQQQQ